jgi:nitroreductase
MTQGADVCEALYTTRAMRRMRPDPVPLDVQARIIDAAVRAPSGGDAQPWRFLLVDDPAVKVRLAAPYRESVAMLWLGHYAAQVAAARAEPESPSTQGVGSALTNVLDIFRPDTTRSILGVPPDRGWQLKATVALGYPRGRWGVAPRQPAHQVTFRNAWGAEPGFSGDQPLWSMPTDAR